jgi:hypothetical protein
VSVQIFLSYARADDELPPHMEDGDGFVTTLYQQLRYEFRQRGDPEPTMWRDIRAIEPGDQFDPIIGNAIDASELLLVVLSPNWMRRPNCKKELDLFKERWRQDGEEGVRHRIIVACKRFVERGRRPSLLQGQQGYDFFAFDGPDETGQQIDFFAHGTIRSKRYHDRIEELAGILYRRAQKLDKVFDEETIERREAEHVRKRSQTDETSGGDDARRKIYLAKPASDMREPYARLVEELSRNGYAVVPDPDFDIPQDATATAFIDHALAEAALSIHLLGEREGYTPERANVADAAEPIVKLQLTRARARLTADAGKSDGKPGGFTRIIWAPETVNDIGETVAANGQPASAGAASTTAPTTRLPQDVLARFGDFQSTDKLVGGTLSKFVDFIVDHLRKSDAPGEAPVEPTDDDWIYVYHVPEDTKYACDLMDALKQHGVAAYLPALEGEQSEVRRVHKERLAECSAVVLCWAQATEVWAHANAHELKDWKKLGRQKKFAYRALLAGPPPGVRKDVFVKYPPANEIDVVVNLSEDDRPLAEAIDRFTLLAPPPAK